MRLGVPRDYFTALLDPEVASAFERLCGGSRDAGAVLEDVAIRTPATSPPVYTHIVLPRRRRYHAKTLDSQPDDYTPNVRLGSRWAATSWPRTTCARCAAARCSRAKSTRRSSGHDALLLPTLPMPAPRLGVATVKLGGVEEPVRNMMLRLTQLFNVTGHPAITLPCGATTDGPADRRAAGRPAADEYARPAWRSQRGRARSRAQCTSR